MGVYTYLCRWGETLTGTHTFETRWCFSVSFRLVSSTGCGEENSLPPLHRESRVQTTVPFTHHNVPHSLILSSNKFQGTLGSSVPSSSLWIFVYITHCIGVRCIQLMSTGKRSYSNIRLVNARITHGRDSGFILSFPDPYIL